MGNNLPSPRGCVFDAYGTLFDFASAAAGCEDVLRDKTGALTRLWRDKQLEYTWLRTLQGRYVDFWEVTGDALDYALDDLRLEDEQIRDRLMSLYLSLATFPDVADCLGQLKSAGLATSVLSNGSTKMLHRLISGAKLEALLDNVFSVDQAGVFKPHPKVYQLAVDGLRIPANEIVFVPSNAWDAYAASAFGMRIAWCNRYGQRRERLPGNPHWEIRTLTELPQILFPVECDGAFAAVANYRLGSKL